MPKLRQLSTALISIGLLAMIAFLNNQLWPQIQAEYYAQSENPEVLPDPEFARVAALGFDNFLADLYWLKVNQYIGANVYNQSFPALFDYLDLITSLSPEFSPAYTAGALILPQDGQAEKALTLLNKGQAALASNWQLYWQAGFIHYFYLEDYQSAIAAYKECQKRDGCLQAASNIIGNLESKRGKWDLAFAEWQRIFETTDNSSTQELALKKMEEASDLAWLNERLREFVSANGRLPKNLEELKTEFLNYKERFQSPFDHNPYVLDKQSKRIKTKNW
jgi:hypothetical protein